MWLLSPHLREGGVPLFQYLLSGITRTESMENQRPAGAGQKKKKNKNK
jgi:hypothetical protein